MLFEVGADGLYYDLNPPRDANLAAMAATLIGKTVEELLPPKPAAICMSALREADETGISFGKQFWLTLAGEKYWFELSIARKQTEAG